MYYEETAWCWEIKEKGFELSILKDSVVYHKASDNGNLYKYYMFRNRFLLIKKYNINIFYKLLLKEIKVLLKHIYSTIRYNQSLPEDYLLKWKAIGFLIINKI
jgi:GT2 family glycosyltransferase